MRRKALPPELANLRCSRLHEVRGRLLTPATQRIGFEEAIAGRIAEVHESHGSASSELRSVSTQLYPEDNP